MSASAAANAPDERVYVAGHECSLWWSHTPRLAGRRTGFVGSWPGIAGEAGTALLSAAKQRLHVAGCEVAVGPIDGSTWHRYRLVVEDCGDAPFFFEPTMRDDGSFAAAGFRPIAEYRSNVVATGPGRVEPPDGTRFRSFRRNDAVRELGLFHAIAVEAFRDAFLYAPIACEDFLALYCPVLPLVDADLALIAERNGRPVGFVFAVPEPGRARVVIKTVAVRDTVRGRGIGTALMRAVEARAHERGHGEAVHALAHDRNASLRFSRGRGRLLRRYALLGCALGPDARSSTYGAKTRVVRSSGYVSLGQARSPR